jgi:kynureninase
VLDLIPSRDGRSVEIEDIEKGIDEDTAVVVLSLVSFKSSFFYDLERVTQIAHDNGALVIWDLSHAVGAVPIDLDKAGADMAVGCTYKYLNGGPGSPAFLYINESLQNDVVSPIWGWFGDKDPFSFRMDYDPAEGINRFKVGTPPVMSLSAIEPALNISLCAGIEKTRAKSVMQTEYLVFLVKEYLGGRNFELGSPGDPDKRGSHITIKHEEGYRICKSLISPPDSGTKVIPDFREPDNIRLGVAPLYNTYEEIFTAVRRIEEITREKLYEVYSVDREGVT